jgi:Fur family transcriptional regulator, ferric uptake regulator
LRLSLDSDIVTGMPDADTIVAAFDDAGYRVTEPRRSLARLIGGRRGHFTAEDLVSDSRSQRLGVGRATVFRSLEILTDLGVVERLDLPSGDHAFVACDPAHHHHVVCSNCGQSTDVGDSGMGRVLEEVARRSGYRIESHRLELFGLCPSCQATRTRRD